MLDRNDTRTPQPPVVTHALLGQGQLFQAGASEWAAFKKEFTPTGRKVTVLIDVLHGCVHSFDVDLYRDIEAQYSDLVPKVVQSVRSRISSKEETIQKGFTLDTIDIRAHIRPSACVLHYTTDQAGFEFDWYVRVSRDYRVESCGERD